ncbi:hypothetical protein LINGRAHAP2_LOCUS8439 [Linum grandiflorum]
MKFIAILSILFLVSSTVTLQVDGARVNEAEEITATALKHCTTPIYNHCEPDDCKSDCLRHFGPTASGWCWAKEDLCLCEYTCGPQLSS